MLLPTGSLHTFLGAHPPAAAPAPPGVSVAEAAVPALAEVASAQALTLNLQVLREAYLAARLPPFSQLSGLTA